MLRSLLALALVGACAVPASAADPARHDDAYHGTQFAGGSHDASYAEWWYFNLIDPAQNVQLAVTYMVIDPANLTGFGLSSVAAIAYTPSGAFTETAVYPTTSFAASSEQADVIIAGGTPATWNAVHVLGDDVYQVAGAIHQQHDISWNLVYWRRAAAWLGADGAHVGVLQWEAMSWLQYMPSAFVTGDVTIDGHMFHVANVRGYHDHNWGEWVPFDVTWNWAQFAGAGIDFSIGDFRNSATGVISVDSYGDRTVFDKGQYQIVHGQWTYDPANQLWFPQTTLVMGQTADRILIVSINVNATVPVRPPPQLPLPLVPVIYEQTADYAGWLWERDTTGAWHLTRTFGGPGFKEYTGVSSVR